MLLHEVINQRKKPRKGTVRYEIAKRRKEEEQKRPEPKIKDERYGNARIIRNETS